MVINNDESADYTKLTSYALAEEIIRYVSLGQAAAIRQFISQHGNVDFKDQFGNCAILMAACCNNLEAMAILLREGKAEVDVADYFGNTPRSWAEKNQNPSMANLINNAMHSKPSRNSLSSKP